METKIPTWFKLKRYPHIGLPLRIKDLDWVSEYVTNTNNIAKHSFLPFIQKIIVKRKFRSDKSNKTLNPSGKKKRIEIVAKPRDILYASHLDAMIYSFYNEKLVDAYEKYLLVKNYKDSIVAYRKIKLNIDSKQGKCNIDFAKSVFEFIQNNKDKNLSVIVADVTSFFDNLDHKYLKKQWYRILGETSLPDDHYNVFSSLTNIRFVNSRDLFDYYQDKIFVETGKPNNSKRRIKKRKTIKSSKYLKEKNAIAYCDKKEFLKNNLNLIQSRKVKDRGIPQGSPISATLANIYMLDFDREVFERVSDIYGFYQRYSDDLIIVCEQQYEDDMIKLLRDRIENLVKLDIKPEKTKLYRFEFLKGKFTGFEVNEDSKKPNFNKTLEYLGFTFDGSRVLIKSSGFSKFYRTMKSSINRATSYAINSKNPDKSLFKSKLYKRFTYKGAGRKRIYHPSKLDKSKFEKSDVYYWGNYLSYSNKANDTMLSLNIDPLIKNQTRKFWSKFNKLLSRSEEYIKLKTK